MSVRHDDDNGIIQVTKTDTPNLLSEKNTLEWKFLKINTGTLHHVHPQSLKFNQQPLTAISRTI